MEPPEVADTRMTLDQLEATLPKGWACDRTLEGRFLFYEVDSYDNHWEHPDPHVEKATYELPTHDEKFDPHYEALSYVWGSNQKPHVLTVEVDQSCTQLPVTDSLMTALRHLRRSNESRRLWIDAVCINQSDLVEVANQVQRMGLIYKLAYRVVVWLGPESHGSAHALATLSYLGAQVEVQENTGGQVRAPFAEEPTWFSSEIALPYSKHTCDTILALLQRPWFQRVWTIQEVQLGSQQPGPIFQCGFETIERYTFYRAVFCLYAKSVTSTMEIIGQSPGLADRLTLVYRLLEPMAGYVFWDILRHGTIPRLCTDGRDKVYGTIGLLPKRFASKIKIDYGINNTPGQVYKETFLTHAQHVERLELLTACFVTARSIPDAPSWVPDWQFKIPGGSYHEKQFAAGTSRAHFTFTTEEPDLIEVLGVSCAVVSHVSDYLPEGLDRQDAFGRIQQWSPLDLDTATYRPTGEPLRTAYARTLIENYVRERWNHPDLGSIEEWVEQSSGKSEGLDYNIITALSHCSGRTLVQTHEGYIGLAPAETRPGDVVTIFLGCSNPMVLRLREGRYSVIGESFVYGLEDAIRLLGPLPEPWRVEVTAYPRISHDHSFVNSRTGEKTREDPRLEPLQEWSRISRVPDGDDPVHYDFFKHQETGIVVNYDPRLEPEMLEKRGVELRKFVLV